MRFRSGVQVWPAEVVRVEVGPGLVYWTVLSGPTLTPVSPVDHYLRHPRSGRGRGESTTKTYAGHLKRFEQWRCGRGLTGEQAAREIAGHLIHRRMTPRTGRGRGRWPTEAALGLALAAIHGFYRHAADAGDVDRSGLAVLFEIAELTVPGRAEQRAGLRLRLRVDTRPSYPAHLGSPRATPGELAVVLEQITTARDACLLGFLDGLGLCVGQLAAGQREDVHLVPPGRRSRRRAFQHGPIGERFARQDRKGQS